MSAFTLFLNYKACWKLAFLALVCPCFLCAFSLIPDEIALPDQIQKRTPEQIKAVFFSLEQQYNQKTPNIWSLKYQQAMLLKNKDKLVFCEIMKKLGASPAFPLKSLALIQSYEICPYPPDLKMDIESYPDWLKLRLAEAFYKRRKTKFNQPEQTLKATLYLGENSPDKKVQVSYLKHALALSKDQKNEKEIHKITLLLYKLSPSLNPQPLPKHYFLVAEDFRQKRKFKKAIEFYIRVLNFSTSSFREKDLAFKGLNRIYKIQRNTQKKIRNFRQWSKWLLAENTKQSLKKYYKLRLDLAGQEWNRNENQKAIQLVTDILKDPKSESISAQALYLRGLIYIQEKQQELSLQDWDQAEQKLIKKRSNTELLGKILWKKAKLFRKLKKYKLALDNLKSLEKINKNPYTGYKALYWKGRTFYDLNQKGLAKKTFETLIKQDHFGYYGLLARKTLNKKPKFENLKRVDKNFKFSKYETEENMIQWLTLVQEPQLLSRFLDAHKNRFINQKRVSLKGWVRIIWLWSKAKRYLELFQLIGQMEDKFKQQILTKYSHFLFPIDFIDEVKEAATKYQIPPALILAIIRQESAFNVRARSKADAFGLMQLLPSTARQTAKRSKIPYRNFKDLYRPGKNILLGTAYLQSLLKQYNNSFIFSISAYNAGSTAVKKWKNTMPDANALDFIENIAYEETRTYIRLIIRNYVFYHNQLGVGQEWFPNWSLQ